MSYCYMYNALHSYFNPTRRRAITSTYIYHLLTWAVTSRQVGGILDPAVVTVISNSISFFLNHLLQQEI